MAPLVCAALLLVLTSLAATVIVGGRENEAVAWSGNTTNGFEWNPPYFDHANGHCLVSKEKSYFVPTLVKINGSHSAPFILQALFGPEWSAAAHIYIYENQLDKSNPCANLTEWSLEAALRWQTLVVLKPGTYIIAVTSVGINKNQTVARSGGYVARLFPADSYAPSGRNNDTWHPPVFHFPFNCQQQQSTPRPFLHEQFVATENGPRNINVFMSGAPREANTTVWVFAGNFTIENGTVVNDCEAKFLAGTTDKDMSASVYANLTKGQVYTVAVEFDKFDNHTYWGMSIEPADHFDSNRTQAVFAGVPAFRTDDHEAYVCAATGVNSKYGIHYFKAEDVFYALDFKRTFANDTIISLYAGTQTASTGCRNFIAATYGDQRGPSRLYPILLPLQAGNNYTIIVSSKSGAGGFYELMSLTGKYR